MELFQRQLADRRCCRYYLPQHTDSHWHCGACGGSKSMAQLCSTAPFILNDSGIGANKCQEFILDTDPGGRPFI